VPRAGNLVNFVCRCLEVCGSQTLGALRGCRCLCRDLPFLLHQCRGRCVLNKTWSSQLHAGVIGQCRFIWNATNDDDYDTILLLLLGEFQRIQSLFRLDRLSWFCALNVLCVASGIRNVGGLTQLHIVTVGYVCSACQQHFKMNLCPRRITGNCSSAAKIQKYCSSM
jgi:hypothetical protein